LPVTDADQGENAFPVFAILRMDAAAEPAVGLNAQMIAGFVRTAFGAGGTPRLDNSTGQLAHLFKFLQV
jgi:hypothetical protein